LKAQAKRLGRWRGGYADVVCALTLDGVRRSK